MIAETEMFLVCKQIIFKKFKFNKFEIHVDFQNNHNQMLLNLNL